MATSAAMVKSSSSVSHHQFAFYDLLPTFCEVAGIHDFPTAYQSNENDRFDGISFYPTLRGREETQTKHDFLYWEFHETNMIGVRQGDWKMVVERGKPRLYNLSTDLHEDHDIAAQHPDVVRALIDIIYQQHTDSPLFPITLPQRP